MKKLITAALTIALAAAMSTTAFAANNATLGKDGSQDIDVYAKYSDTTITPASYSVDVEWGEMKFTYTFDGEYVWDKNTHTNTLTNSNPKWTAEGNTVKVTNHSNRTVNAKFDFAKTTTDSITGDFTYDNSKTAGANGVALAAGVVNQPTAADFVTATLALSGTMSANTTGDFAKIGSVTITLS